MALVRGFGVFRKETDEDRYEGKDGYIFIPSNVRFFLGVEPNEGVIINALRIEGTTRYPHAVLFLPDQPPLLSPAEMIMAVATALVEEKGRISLPAEITEVMRLEHNYRVEMKVQGPTNEHWVMLYNRGPRRFTTLRERMGVDRGNLSAGQVKKPKTQVWEY
ncbi:hypothetical protein MYX84_07850 [Acidobacteria bacterium AH-259-O06]|nr:hypothetical protein [Acidobacteria bacterium AH-259-O06]